MLDYLGHSGYPGPLLDVVLVTIHTYMNNLYEEKNCKIFFFLLRCEKVLSLAPTWSPSYQRKDGRMVDQHHRLHIIPIM